MQFLFAGSANNVTINACGKWAPALLIFFVKNNSNGKALKLVSTNRRKISQIYNTEVNIKSTPRDVKLQKSSKFFSLQEIECSKFHVLLLCSICNVCSHDLIMWVRSS